MVKFKEMDHCYESNFMRTFCQTTIYLERVATGKRNLNVEKIRTLLLEYVLGPGQVSMYLKTVAEQLNFTPVLMKIYLRLTKCNGPFDLRKT